MENKIEGSAVDIKAIQPKLFVGIGGSAGALNAYKALLEAMPPKQEWPSSLFLT